MRSEHSLSTHLAIWLIVPCLEVYLSGAHPMRHSGGEIALEFGVFAALGALQWRFGGRHWLGSLSCAGLLPLLVAIVVRVPADRITQLFYTAGALLLAVAFLKDAGRAGEGVGGGRGAVALGVAVAIGGTLGAYAIDFQRQVQAVAGRLGDQGSGFADQYLDQLLWVFAGPPAGSRSAPPPAGGEAGVRPPIVLVSVDTLRADAARGMRTHAWLAEHGRWWPSAMSTSSWTLPAVASIQTGLLPAAHGATCLYDAHCQGLAPDARTVAEDLTARGYRSVALTTNPWISGPLSVARGYQEILDFASLSPFRMAIVQRPGRGHPQDAAVLVDAALAWLEAAPKDGTLLWLHLIDPHLPYAHTPALAGLTVQALRAGGSQSEATRTLIRAGYDREVDHVDTQLMRLIAWLEADGFFERGLFVLTSDHGEEFWEHGGVEHGHSHHAEVVEVPLALAGLGVTPGRDDGVVSLLDVASTLRAVAGVPSEGVDLRAPTDATGPDRILRAQGVMVGPLTRSARDAHSRVIARGDPDFEPVVTQRYDLATDPAERTPIPATPDDPIARAALETRAPAEGEALPVNQDALRALGYIE